MSDLPAISVLIASHGRPALLVRALRFIAQSDHPALEVVVAADAAGLGALAAAAFAGRIKTREVAVANIAVARNAALGAAAGGIVAFIDDDAVPEPGWARALALAFADPRRVAAGGRVRRRGGWEDEAPPVAVDARGADHTLGRWSDVAAGTLPAPAPGMVAKLQGTNCAFRTEALRAAGGFDPAFAYFLDYADICRRLAPCGTIAFVPGAEVQHERAAGPHRGPDRAPRDLYEVGASLAVFLRRHAQPADHAAEHAAARAAFVAEQRRRLLRHMIAGRLGPEEVARLMRRLGQGLAAGAARALAPLGPLPDAAPPFLPFGDTGPRPGRILRAPLLGGAATRDAALQAREAGQIVTVIGRRAGLGGVRIGCDASGVWHHRLAFRAGRAALAAEAARIAALRPPDPTAADPLGPG
ncbi:MAG: hypothetical protein RLZ26_2730 [Pseudomonadota bacterium]